MWTRGDKGNLTRINSQTLSTFQGINLQFSPTYCPYTLAGDIQNSRVDAIPQTVITPVLCALGDINQPLYSTFARSTAQGNLIYSYLMVTCHQFYILLYFRVLATDI